MGIERLRPIKNRVKKYWSEADAIRIYDEHPRDQVAFREEYRAKAKTYGIDPVTIMILLQLAIRLYFWCKEQGFLDQAPTRVPTFEELFDSSDEAAILAASAMDESGDLDPETDTEVESDE